VGVGAASRFLLVVRCSTGVAWCEGARTRGCRWARGFAELYIRYYMHGAPVPILIHTTMPNRLPTSRSYRHSQDLRAPLALFDIQPRLGKCWFAVVKQLTPRPAFPPSHLTMMTETWLVPSIPPPFTTHTTVVTPAASPCCERRV
jgi:hypothetical protein